MATNLEDPSRFARILFAFDSDYRFYSDDDQVKCTDDQNNTETVRFIHPEASSFGYENYLIDYLTCQLDLTLVMQESQCWSYENSTQICSYNNNLNERLVRSTEYVPILLEYVTEILSVLKYDDDLTCFSFFKLYSIQVWFLILFSLFSIGIILQFKNQSDLTLIECLSILLKNFLNQPAIVFDRLKLGYHKNDLGGKIIMILLIIWILCFTVLSKCLTSFLLQTYSIKTPSLTVETLQDIIDDPGLFVAGMVGLKALKPFKPEVYESLEERVKEYEKRMDINPDDVKQLGSKSLVLDLIQRKSVYILSSFGTKMLQLLYPESNLKQSDHKSNQLFKYSFVSKNNSKHKRIYRFLKACYEVGITDKFFSVIQTVAEMYGKTRNNNDFVTINMDSNAQAINLKVFSRGPLLILFTGLVISMVVILLEMIIMK